jgi:hypothetical protein
MNISFDNESVLEYEEVVKNLVQNMNENGTSFNIMAFVFGKLQEGYAEIKSKLPEENKKCGF